MVSHRLGSYWLVEEKDYTTGDIRYSQSFSDYNEAFSVYTERRSSKSMNTVSLEKFEKELLQE